MRIFCLHWNLGSFLARYSICIFDYVICLDWMNIFSSSEVMVLGSANPLVGVWGGLSRNNSLFQLNSYVIQPNDLGHHTDSNVLGHH